MGLHKLVAGILHEEDYCWCHPVHSGKSTDFGRWGPLAETESKVNSCYNYCMTLLAWNRRFSYEGSGRVRKLEESPTINEG